jgi:hypothetical protein
MPSTVQIVAIVFLAIGSTFIGAGIARGEYDPVGKLTRAGVLAWLTGIGAVLILYHLP